MRKFLTITCTALASLSLALGAAACTPEREPSTNTTLPSAVADLDTMNALYVKYEAPEKAMTKAETVTGLDGYDYVATAGRIGDGRFLRFEKKNATGQAVSIAIYNAVTGKVHTFDCASTPEALTRTWSFTTPDFEDEDAAPFAQNVLIATLDYQDFTTPTNNYKKTNVYGVDGAELANILNTFGGASVSYEKDTYLLTINSGAGATKSYFNKDFVLLPSAPNPFANMFVTDSERVLESYDRCYLVGATGEETGYLCVNDEKEYVSYTKDMVLQYTLDIPENVEKNALILFDSGSYLLQYSERITDVSAEYDYLAYGPTDVYYEYEDAEFTQYGLNKYKLTTLLVDVTANATTELDCQLLLKNASVTPAKNTKYALPEGIGAFFKGIGEIGEDKKVKYGYDDVWFGVSETGVVTREASLMEGEEVVSAQELSDGNLKVKVSTNRVYLITKEGAIIKEINERVIEETTVLGASNEAFTQLIDGGIYNKKYDKVYTPAANCVVEKWLNSALIIKETIVNAAIAPATDPTYTYKWYLLKSTDLAPVLIADSSKGQTAAYIEGIGYAVTTTSGTAAEANYSKTCVYYNEEGVALDIDSKVVISSLERVYDYRETDGDEKGYFFYAYNVYDVTGEVKSTSIMKFGD